MASNLAGDGRRFSIELSVDPRPQFWMNVPGFIRHAGSSCIALGYMAARGPRRGVTINSGD